MHLLLFLTIIGGVKSGNTPPPQNPPSQNHMAIPLPKGVTRFIELLVQPKTPTHAEIQKKLKYTVGLEFIYAKLECKSRGWDANSKDCFNFKRYKMYNTHKVPSLRFTDIRRRLPDIVGKKYKVISVRVKNATGEYLTAKEVIHMDKEAIAIGVTQVKIGKNVYELHYRPAVSPVVDVVVATVNGKVFYERTEESFLHAKAWEKYQKTSKHP